MATTAEDFGKKVRAHQSYQTADGTYVPGVTTVLGVLNKPALVAWANREGLKGNDTSKIVSEAGAVGTLAHYRIECELKGEVPDFDDFTPAQVRRSVHAVAAFHKWLDKREHFQPILVEEQLVSNKHSFGGTIDCLAEVDGALTLLDFKTTKGIWPEALTQAAAYWWLLREHEHAVEGVRILRIPRVESEGVDERILTGAQVLHNWKIFQACLTLYNLRRAAE